MIIIIIIIIAVVTEAISPGSARMHGMAPVESVDWAVLAHTFCGHFVVAARELGWLGSRVVSVQAQKGPGSNRSRDAVG